VLGKREGGLDLRVLDSTAPDAVRAAAQGFDLRKTLFLVSSKSGGTTEVDAFYRYFRGKVDDGASFVAITDADYAAAEAGPAGRVSGGPSSTLPTSGPATAR